MSQEEKAHPLVALLRLDILRPSTVPMMLWPLGRARAVSGPSSTGFFSRQPRHSCASATMRRPRTCYKRRRVSPRASSGIMRFECARYTILILRKIGSDCNSLAIHRLQSYCQGNHPTLPRRTACYRALLILRFSYRYFYFLQ
jgi:hypothetical protein